MSNEHQHPSKRQRSAILAPSDQNELLQLLDLPVQQHFISFLNLSDRLNLAETCRQATKEVDAYCEKVLGKITGPNNRNVDGTFHVRIRDQTSFVTKRTKPVHLPPRYLLWVALRKEPLYKIQLSEDLGVEYMLLSPSENRVIVEAWEQRRIYDLRTRLRLARLDFDWTASSLFFLDDTCIIASTEEGIFLWSQEGDGFGNHNWPMRTIYRAGGVVRVSHCVRLCQHCILFAALINLRANGEAPNQARLVFQTLDARSAHTDTYATLSINLRDEGFSADEYLRAIIAGIVDQKWLLFRLYGRAIGNGGFRVSGLYVYNLETKTKNFVWSRNDGIPHGCQLHQSCACPGTFCIVLENGNDNLWRAVILQLDTENGRLSELSSFPIRPYTTIILGFSETHLFVTENYAGGEVKAFHLETGHRDWSIDLGFLWNDSKSVRKRSERTDCSHGS